MSDKGAKQERKPKQQPPGARVYAQTQHPFKDSLCYARIRGGPGEIPPGYPTIGVPLWRRLVLALVGRSLP